MKRVSGLGLTQRALVRAPRVRSRHERGPAILAAIYVEREVAIARALIGAIELDYLSATGRIEWGEFAWL